MFLSGDLVADFGVRQVVEVDDVELGEGVRVLLCDLADEVVAFCVRVKVRMERKEV